MSYLFLNVFLHVVEEETHLPPPILIVIDVLLVPPVGEAVGAGVEAAVRCKQNVLAKPY